MTKPTKAQIAAALREYMTTLARRGAKLGGKARAASMTADERSASARNAVNARWAKAKKRKKKSK